MQLLRKKPFKIVLIAIGILMILLATESCRPDPVWGAEMPGIVQTVCDRYELIRDHEHSWKNGQCTICKTWCTHENHTKEGVCLTCGRKAYHTYRYGLCRCGNVLQFQYELLPHEYYFEDCDEPGTLQTVELKGQLSDVSPTIAGKKFEVYTPYGYSPNRKYDVMFLQGGLGSHYNACTSEKWWLTDNYDQQFIFKTVWDHMIKNGDCRPMIIVSVDGYSAKHGADRYRDLYEETVYFVRNYIYPYVIDHYSTYAKSSDPNDIIAAREHFGYGGFSNGGYMSYWGCMNSLLDYCANLMPIAGSWRSAELIDKVYQCKDEYPIICFYSGAGVNDGYAYEQTLEDYVTIVNGSGYLTDGVNAWFVETNYGHDLGAESIHFFNGLRVMFPEPY